MPRGVYTRSPQTLAHLKKIANDRPESWYINQSESHKGKHPSEETLLKMSESHKGIKPSEETLDKLRAPKSEETKARISKSKMGVSRPESVVQMLRDRQTGKHPSEETRKKLSNSRMGNTCRLGKRDSEETKLKKSDAIKGENNPNWNGGSSFEPYCPKFTKEFKERVRSFFGYICLKCGHRWQIGEKKLAVHHVNYHKDACCNEEIIPLFVPVCHGKCHLETNTNRHFWEDWFTEIITEFYNGKCYFTKEEMEKFKKESG